MRTCSIEGCDRIHAARGMCLMHYKRWRNHGDPTIRAPRTPELERFLARFSVTPGCWEWTGSRMTNGYGKFGADEGTVLAHRFAYELHLGLIPEGLVVDHLCRNRACVNPEHLQAVTNEENLRRGAGFGLRNGMRTACVNGHEYLPENSYTDPSGGLRCRQCARNSDRNRANRKSA